jgi:uncharacterized protein YlzI (FlbEa/FlbD family)
MNLIKATSALTKAPLWIWVEQIAVMTINQDGGAVLHLSNGSTYALKEKPDQVLETIKALQELTQLEEAV